MWNLLKELDRILRGERTSLPALREGTIRFPLAGIAAVLFALGMVYGFFMGWFSLFNRPPQLPLDASATAPETEAGVGTDWRQVLASTVKVPLLFILTLIVTFPSLYVFNTLVGSRLLGPAVLRLLVAGMAVTMAVLASFGPIVAFFSVTTESYAFIVLLNVVLFAVAGILGCAFLLQTLHRLSIAGQLGDGDLRAGGAKAQAIAGDEGELGGPPAMPGRIDVHEREPATPHISSRRGALERLEGHVLGPHVKAVFRIWIVVFGLVGAQMAWILRPFIGNPAIPFTWLRDRRSNFFESVWTHLVDLFN